VLLDALGTLVALEPPWPALVRELRLRHRIEITLEQAVTALRAEMAYYRAHSHEAHDAATLADLRRRCAQVVAETISEPIAEPIAEPISELDLDALTDTLLAALRFQAYPDAEPALAKLRATGVRAVVVSNWDVSLHSVLAQTGLAPLLDGTLTSAEFGAAKPAPAIFAAALELAGATAAAALHVGDSFEEDVLGARAAGIEPLLLVRDPGPLLAPAADPPDPTLLRGVRTIASLAELAPDAA
jgi:putative hydrolase of the HAD superfamily